MNFQLLPYQKPGSLRTQRKLPNYNSVHYVRVNRPGSGVSLFIHYDYGFKIRHDLCLNSTINVNLCLLSLCGLLVPGI